METFNWNVCIFLYITQELRFDGKIQLKIEKFKCYNL